MSRTLKSATIDPFPVLVQIPGFNFNSTLVGFGFDFQDKRTFYCIMWRFIGCQVFL